MDCLFCGIVARSVPADVVYEDEHVLAFRDIRPQAPVHVLLIPKEHVARLADVTDAQLAGRLALAAARVAREAGHGDDFRLVVNSGAGAGQTVWHLHYHVLAGRPLTWPPG